MSSLDQSYELIGRILAKLILAGLRRRDMSVSDVVEGKASLEDRRHFSDVMMWLLTEGLITRGSNFYNGTFVGVQLTSKGISAVEKGTFVATGGSVRETVEAKPEGGLGSDTYGKIGSFIGGLFGGFAQSAQ